MAKCFCTKCNMQVNRLSNYQCPNCMTLIFKDDIEYQKYNNRMAHKRNADKVNQSTVNKEILDKVSYEPQKEITVLQTSSSENIQTSDNTIKSKEEDNGKVNTSDKDNTYASTIKTHPEIKEEDVNKSEEKVDTASQPEENENENLASDNKYDCKKSKSKKKKKSEEKRICVKGFNPNQDGYYNDTPYTYEEPKDNFFKETLKKILIGIVIFILILIIYVWYWIS